MDGGAEGWGGCQGDRGRGGSRPELAGACKAHEVVLQGARIVTIVGELEPAGMAKHVRVDREWHVSGFPEALDEAMEANGADWPAALGNEYVGVLRVLAS